jgi:hypothetical protein|tara:strand:+ start:670 stop:987 length:318 start_codon:yes stop_codon:yes gene_type:complete
MKDKNESMNDKNLRWFDTGYKATSKHCVYDGVEFHKGSWANQVARSIGFKNTWDMNASSFRMEYSDLFQKGKFDNCSRFGDYLNVYLESLRAFKDELDELTKGEK